VVKLANHIVSTVVVKRPNPEVPFKSYSPAIPPDQLESFIQINFIDTGKLLSRTSTISEDELTLTYITCWKDDAARFEYQKNIFVKTQFDHLVEYRKAHGITVEYNNKEFRGSTIIREWSGTF
jgi:hypothetical protein